MEKYKIIKSCFIGGINHPVWINICEKCLNQRIDKKHLELRPIIELTCKCDYCNQ